MELISVYNAQNAHLIKQTLEAHGIRSELLNEHTVQLVPQIGAAIGGIKIIVSEADFDEATKIVNSVLNFQTREKIISKPSSFDSFLSKWNAK